VLVESKHYYPAELLKLTPADTTALCRALAGVDAASILSVAGAVLTSSTWNWTQAARMGAPRGIATGDQVRTRGEYVRAVDEHERLARGDSMRVISCVTNTFAHFR
jgi:hypothetical protein